MQQKSWGQWRGTHIGSDRKRLAECSRCRSPCNRSHGNDLIAQKPSLQRHKEAVNVSQGCMSCPAGEVLLIPCLWDKNFKCFGHTWHPFHPEFKTSPILVYSSVFTRGVTFLLPCSPPTLSTLKRCAVLTHSCEHRDLSSAGMARSLVVNYLDWHSRLHKSRPEQTSCLFLPKATAILLTCFCLKDSSGQSLFFLENTASGSLDD